MFDLRLTFSGLTESAAELRIEPMNDEVTAVAGTLYGPLCKYAKTLPSQFSLQDIGGAATVLVIDPCYWTPALPFLYQLLLEVRDRKDQVHRQEMHIGLRRWQMRGRDFWLEGRRTVLRGMRLAKPTNGDLQAAREVETALVVRDPSDAICAEASELGVALIADLRSGKSDVRRRAEQLTWFASVLVLLVDEEQAAQLHDSPLPIAQRVTASCDVSAVEGDVLAVEISPTETPSTAVREFPGPVIALQTDSAPQLATARAACDKLQARLAPEFDLAGYFVQ